MFRLHGGGPRLGGHGPPDRAGAGLGAALGRAARQLFEPAASAAGLGLRRPRLVLRVAIGVNPVDGLRRDRVADDRTVPDTVTVELEGPPTTL